MSDLFNHLMDVAVAAGVRVLELPVAVVFALAAALLAGIWILARETIGRRYRELMQSPLWMALALFVALALIVDHHMSSLLIEVRSMKTDLKRVETQVRAARPADGQRTGASPGRDTGVPIEASARRDVLPQAGLFDAARLQRELAERFDTVAFSVEREAAGVEYVWLQLEHGGTPVQCHVAVVDLTQPGLEVVITPEFDEKWKTSDFAERYGCAVAVNGEAGRSPKPRCGLGEWTGNWIVRGDVVLLEDSEARPFLSFDRDNRARYSREALVDREVTPEKYNTIWGRVDLLAGGEVVARQVARAPRCCMGIDAEGETLYLMVVDGRRPGHSQGLDMLDTARVLSMFGATDGMSCDQGGSAVMVLASRAGPVSTPCDAEGERGVYSHFGIAIRE